VIFTLPTFNVPFFRKLRPSGSISRLTRIDLDGRSMAVLIDFLISIDIAAVLKEIWLGYYEPISLRDFRSLGIPRLLEAAGTSLRVLDIALANFDVSANASSDVLDTAATPAGNEIDIASFHLDVGHNPGLEQLRLRAQVQPLADYSWIYNSLCNISSTKVNEVYILFDIRRHEPHAAILNEILDVFSPQKYVLIDDLLSSSQFSGLAHVAFSCWAAPGSILPDQLQWYSFLSSMLPKLYARRVLSAAVFVMGHYS